MKMTVSQNGYKAGEEKYTTFHPAHNSDTRFYQYDYRHRDGELFTTVAPTLEECREQRDKWLQAKNYKRLFPIYLQKIESGKRLSKSDMAYQIGQFDPYNIVSLSWNYFKRDEIVSAFNKMFGTEIK